MNIIHNVEWCYTRLHDYNCMSADAMFCLWVKWSDSRWHFITCCLLLPSDWGVGNLGLGSIHMIICLSICLYVCPGSHHIFLLSLYTIYISQHSVIIVQGHFPQQYIDQVNSWSCSNLRNLHITMLRSTWYL